MINHKQYHALTVVVLLAFSIVTIGNLQNSYGTTSPPARECGPMDIAFAIDVTGSMGGALDSVKSELPQIITQAESASGGDLRLGLLTFEDDVNVLHELTSDISSVENSINGLTLGGGGNEPEASDIAKDTAVNNLGSFNEPWRSSAVKILVLITDVPPGGLNDQKDPEDVDRMHNVAESAKAKGILVSDVFVPTNGDTDGQRAILQDDAVTSGGVFIETNADGTGTGNAIIDIIDKCGTANPPSPEEPPTPEGIIGSGNNMNVQVQSNSGSNALGQDVGSSSNQYSDEAIFQGQSTEQDSSVVAP
jgi:hypothetical protein